MAIIEFLGIRGLIGLGVAVVLSALLGLQVHKTHHWQHEAALEKQAYQLERSAFQQTVLNYRNAAAQARDADARNIVRVGQVVTGINRERQSSYEARIAVARSRAERLRPHPSGSGANPGSSPAAPVSSVPAAPSGPSSHAEDGLSLSDRLLATEQAIQLDELIKWIYRTHSVDVNGANPMRLSHPELSPPSTPTASQ